MIKETEIQNEMLLRVARALGPELLEQVTFVGGCTTGLLLTDTFTLESVRHTEDVDLIVHVMGYNGYARLQEQLRKQGFMIVAPTEDEDFPICAMKLGDLRVDVMPDDPTVLGFSNRWYSDAMKSSSSYALDQEISIQLVSPVYFIATKLEAWNGRGKGDVFGSRDIEDIIHLIDGREELGEELCSAPAEVRHYIAEQLTQLSQLSQFEYVVSSQAGSDSGREEVIFERIEGIIKGTRN